MVSARRSSVRGLPAGRSTSVRVAGARFPIARALLAALVSVPLLVLTGMPAAADPPPPAPAPPAPAAPTAAPTTVAGAQAQLDQVQREAEALTEQWHAAQDDLAARRADLTKLQAAVAPAQAAADTARADEENYRKQVDAVALATFEGGNLDQLDALLAARSPQDFLDQMSALEQISSQYKDVLDALMAKVAQATQARADADAAVERAQAAAEQADKAEQDLAARKRDAEMRIDQAQQLLERLTPAQRRERNDNGAPAPVITGSGVGVEALRAAATQLGKPYRWGAEGPGSYDCSGLVYWAFKQIGITMPRSAIQQATVGTPVAWNDLRPGDLVFYYSPIGHVGIYAGNGTFINAPQTGDVVKYQKVSRTAFATARRL